MYSKQWGKIYSFYILLYIPTRSPTTEPLNKTERRTRTQGKYGA